MILAIDAVGARHGGAASVAAAMVRAALASPGVGRVELLCSPRAERRFGLPEDGRLRVRDIEGAGSPMGRLSWHLNGLARAAAAAGATRLLCLSGGGIGPAGTPTVLLLQQSLPFSGEALATLSAGQRVRQWAIGRDMRHCARRAALVVVQTSVMKESVTRTFRIAPERVVVVRPCAVWADGGGAPEDPRLEGMRRTGRKRTLLYVGNDSMYKNLAMLGPALRHLRAQVPGVTLFATLPADHPLTAEAGLVGVGTLEGDLLREAYCLAGALVLPSLTETVGLPLVEAASQGTPCLVADRPYAREVCGPAALYFDPHDPADLARQASVLLTDPSLWGRLSTLARERSADIEASSPYRALIELVLQAT